jgi:putative ABC transport system substrate-binding protein
MNRRRLLAAVAAGVAAVSARGAQAQLSSRIYRLGILSGGAAPKDDILSSATQMAKFLGGLGYVEGRNLVIDRRYADGDFQALPRLARELVAWPADAIHAIGTAPLEAAGGATKTIPIVFLSNFDPVAAGIVQSLGRPGGNITGILIAPEGSLAPKKLELLREALPTAERIALLDPDDPAAGMQQQIQETRQAAVALKLELPVIVVRGRDYAGAFAALAAARAQALVVGAHSFFVRDQRRIIELAAKYRLSAIYEWPQQVRNGGLMSYGADELEVYKQAAIYIDRVLRGTEPAALPIWQPEKLRIVVNLRTAKALGISLPPSLLVRADEVLR